MNLPEEERANRRFKYLSERKVFANIFGGLYNVLVQKQEMTAFSDHAKEFQDELWRIADEFMPNKPAEEQHKFIQVIMVILWLNNN